jgi:hypothetical protein
MGTVMMIQIFIEWCQIVATAAAEGCWNEGQGGSADQRTTVDLSLSNNLKNKFVEQILYSPRVQILKD